MFSSISVLWNMHFSHVAYAQGSSGYEKLFKGTISALKKKCWKCILLAQLNIRK